MKLGVIIPVCMTHAHQPMSWLSMRKFSRPETPVYVLFNGMAPVLLPAGIQALHEPATFKDEADLWDYCLGFAYFHGWDWCMVVHDDFALFHGGWEAQMERSAGWRVVIASWLAYQSWDEGANTCLPADGHVGVAVDSFAWGFHVPTFMDRGCVCDVRWKYGYGAWEPNAWALRNGYAAWRIHTAGRHQWILGQKPDNAAALRLYRRCGFGRDRIHMEWHACGSERQ